MLNPSRHQGEAAVYEAGPGALLEKVHPLPADPALLQDCRQVILASVMRIQYQKGNLTRALVEAEPYQRVGEVPSANHDRGALGPKVLQKLRGLSGEIAG